MSARIIPNAVYVAALALLFPKRCELCSKWEWENPSAAEQELLCVPCHCALNGAERIGTQSICRACGEPLYYGAWMEEKSHYCSACAVHPLPLRYLRSIFWYGGAPEELIKRLKYHGRRRIARLFAQELFHFVTSGGMPDADWDLIVGLPSAPHSLRNRGYNHTGLVSRELGRRLQLPVSMLALSSCRSRERQVALTAAERRTNMHCAFSAQPRAVAGRRMLILDDVITTGASLNAAAAALISAGARSVDALTVARSLESALVRRAVAAR